MSDEGERRPRRPRGRPIESDDWKEMHVYLYPYIFKKVAQNRGEGESWNHTINRLLETPCPSITDHLPFNLREKLAEEARTTGQTPTKIIQKLLRTRYTPEPCASEKKNREKRDYTERFFAYISTMEPMLYDRGDMREILAKTGPTGNLDRLKRYLADPRAKTLIAEREQCPNKKKPLKLYGIRLNLTCPHYQNGECAARIAAGEPNDTANCDHADPENCPRKTGYEAEKDGQNTLKT